MRTGHRRSDPEPASDRNAKDADNKDGSGQTGVTLSGLPNVLDGFHAPENVVFVMTTNHVEMLDPALLRPGRIDYRLFLGDATDSQRVELYLRFFSEATEDEAREFAQAHSTETMAEFQGLLLALEQDWPSLETMEACGQLR